MLLLVIPVNLVVVSKQRKLQIDTMTIKDQRLKLMSEVLNGIKVLPYSPATHRCAYRPICLRTNLDPNPYPKT